MSSENETDTIHVYLRRIAERIDEQLLSDAGTSICRKVVEGLCPVCRERINHDPVRPGPAPPEVAAVELMLKAAGTKKSIPAASRWKLDSDLQRSLAGEFLRYSSDIIGECQAPARLVEEALEALSVNSALSEFWTQLTDNAGFLRKYLNAYERFEGLISLTEFRLRFVGLCVDRNIHTVEEALPLLEEVEARQPHWKN